MSNHDEKYSKFDESFCCCEFLIFCRKSAKILKFNSTLEIGIEKFRFTVEFCCCE